MYRASKNSDFMLLKLYAVLLSERFSAGQLRKVFGNVSGQEFRDLLDKAKHTKKALKGKTCYKPPPPLVPIAGLTKAWNEDPDITLKLIWNARSIHLGKSSRPAFYRAVGWLAKTHPLTLLHNLPWLVRPLIQKKEDGKKDPFYKALHLVVARLIDLARLNSEEKKNLKKITLAAKWAPSHNVFHDKHTFIVSTIAELLYPFDSIAVEGLDPADRTLYLKHARLAYQKFTLSPLRKFLQIVERPISTEKSDQIKYDRVPSLAMAQYKTLFIRKDMAHFSEYIENVAKGTMRISGATLLPSTLIAAVGRDADGVVKGKGVKQLIEQKNHELVMKTVDGQWKTLVQRIKDSGMLDSSIAVCDVSGSMTWKKFDDGTIPMDSSIGLSLLIAKITQPPFGGAFITFSSRPQVMLVGGPKDKRTLSEKVAYIKKAQCSMNTDFVAVFEKLILPRAIAHKVKPKDMVKQVFVFSDMQFDAAESEHFVQGHHVKAPAERWSTSYKHIRKCFRKAGYEMPKLIFWNLAGGHAGSQGAETDGDDTAPKPVTAHEEGTALVSGYSQGQMKMFLDNGQFDIPEGEEIVEDMEGEDGEILVNKKVQKPKFDPTTLVQRAISHEAYRMLEVVD